eukprot:g4692.t1
MEVLKSALKHSTRIALIVGTQKYTYQALLSSAMHISQRLESYLSSSKAEKSDWGPRVGIYFKPGVEYVAATWATWMAGGIVVPLATSHTKAELQHVIDDAGIRVIQTSEDWKSSLPLTSQIDVHLFDLSSLLTDYQEAFSMPKQTDGALIIYTSGTTGKPKGALHTHHSLNAQMKSLSDAWGWKQEDCILHALPLHHIHGIVNALYCAHYNGACVNIQPKFSPRAVWTSLKSGGISVFMGVPTMYSHLISYMQSLCSEEQEELRSSAQQLRLFVSGSAACPVPLMMKWKELTGHLLLERYGMTEIGMALSNPLDGERRPGYVGIPLPGVFTKLKSDSESVAELLVKGDSLFKEYWNLPNATKESFDEDGYFKTGDIVTVSGSPPYFKILGRASVDIIKCGGYKLSALEIENAILGDNRIKECGVLGIPDETHGEIPVAFISTVDSAQLTASEVLANCTSILAKYKIPRKVVFVENLPRNAMGKINKVQMKETFRTT